MVTIRTASLTLVAVLALPFGCAQSRPDVAAKTTTSPLPSGAVHPMPPASDCVFPDGPSDFAALRAYSNAVVEGVVSEPALVVGTGSATVSFYTLRVDHVVEARGVVGKEVVVAATGGVPVPILPPGEYVLFLTTNVALRAPDVAVTYGLVDGLLGTFAVRDGRVYRECPNYADAGHRISATGVKQGEDVASFEAMVTQEPMPSAAPTTRGTAAPGTPSGG